MFRTPSAHPTSFDNHTMQYKRATVLVLIYIYCFPLLQFGSRLFNLSSMSLALIVCHLNGNEPKLQTNPTSKTFYAVLFVSNLLLFVLHVTISNLFRVVCFSPRPHRNSYQLQKGSDLVGTPRLQHPPLQATVSHKISPQNFLFLGYRLFPPFIS